MGKRSWRRERVEGREELGARQSEHLSWIWEEAELRVRVSGVRGNRVFTSGGSGTGLRLFLARWEF